MNLTEKRDTLEEQAKVNALRDARRFIAAGHLDRFYDTETITSMEAALVAMLLEAWSSGTVGAMELLAVIDRELIAKAGVQ